jgi:hypothetical protein
VVTRSGGYDVPEARPPERKISDVQLFRRWSETSGILVYDSLRGRRDTNWRIFGDGRMFTTYHDGECGTVSWKGFNCLSLLRICGASIRNLLDASKRSVVRGQYKYFKEVKCFFE